MMTEYEICLKIGGKLNSIATFDMMTVEESTVMQCFESVWYTYQSRNVTFVTEVVVRDKYTNEIIRHKRVI